MKQKDKKNIILHVGLGKTGTTFLQKKVFPFIENNFYGGVFTQTPSVLDKISDLIYKNDMKFYKSIEIENTKNKVNNFVQTLKEENIIYSDEGFVAQPYYKNSNNNNVNNAIKQIFPNAKIFFVFRKQSDWIYSYYCHLSKVGKFNNYTSLDNYMGYKQGVFTKNGHLDINQLNWGIIYNKYAKLFGENNVLAIPYELMKEAPVEFLSKFYEFFGIESYYPESFEKVNARSEKLITEINLLLRGYLDFVEFLGHDKVKKIIRKNDKGLRKFLEKIKLFNKKLDYSNEKLNDAQKTQILKIHEQSNRKLAELIGIDLGQYGYY